MTASVQKKRDYYYIVLAWTDETGKHRQKWVATKLTVSGHNKRRAEKMRIEVLNEWTEKLFPSSTITAQTPITTAVPVAFPLLASATPAISTSEIILFSDFLIDWLEKIRYSISKNTYFSYRQTVHNCICPYFAKRKIYLHALTSEHIQTFYNFKMEHDGVSANTIHHYHANIHKALTYAVAHKMINENPSDNIILPKKQRHMARFYSTDELKAIIEGCKGTKIETVVRLASWFGLRRGEIIGLKWDCIDFAQNTLTVMGTMKDKGISGSKKKNMF